MAAGVARERIWLDPGHRLRQDRSTTTSQLLAQPRPDRGRLGFPVLLGVSRKRFIRALDADGRVDRRPARRLDRRRPVGAAQGADVIRVHDVRETVQALKVLERLAP